MDTRIYICTHKTFEERPMEGYIPLNVGSATREDLGYLRDDSGDNISLKNPNYCELTGLYWIWKNVDCDVAGLCHYRRYLSGSDGILNKKETEELLGKYDIILPNCAFTMYDSVQAHYSEKHYVEDLARLRSVISDLYPDYLYAYDFSMERNLMSLGNIMICKKDVFDGYCHWLFDILFAVEKITDLTGYDDFQARLYGYLSERLLRVYVLNSRLKVVTVPVLNL